MHRKLNGSIDLYIYIHANALNGIYSFRGYCIQMNSLLTRLRCIFMVLLLTVHCPDQLAFRQFAPNVSVLSLIHFSSVSTFNKLSFSSDCFYFDCIFYVISNFVHSFFFCWTHFYIFSPNHWHSRRKTCYIDIWSKVAYSIEYNKKYALTCNAVADFYFWIFFYIR